MSTSNSTSSSTASSGSQTTEDPWLGIVGLVGLVGLGAWVDRNHWLAKLAPYGLTTEETRLSYSGYGSETSYGTGHFHINPMGWFTVIVLAVGLVAGLWCVFAVAAWSGWAASGGRRAVPKIPVPAPATATAVMVFVGLLLLFGRQSSAAGHMIVTVLADAVAACVFFAVLTFGTDPAARFRRVQAFAARADQVLGHGHPGVLRVKTPVFSGWDADAEHQQSWPARLVCRAGPGWQHKPAEHAELNRYARECGWPTYTWSYDLMTKQVIGTAADGG
jgi:hypothetical protein